MKVKKCKGAGIAKGYGCGELVIHRKYGLGFECKCYQNWLFNEETGKLILNKTKIQAKNKVEKERKKEIREQKEQNKSIAKLIQEARKPFQEWIRMRDADKLCICCGQDSETWDAGHFYKAEIYSGLIFEEINVNKQRVYCNQYLNGNEGEYRKGMIKKYGIEKVEELDRLAIERKNYKYTREELIAIKLKYKQKLKDFKC